MVELQPSADVVEHDAGHDVHLDDPAGWRDALSVMLEAHAGTMR